MRISVVGGGRASEDERRVAARLGAAIAERGHTLVCGGLGGVMTAACRGAHEAGGTTIGILPGRDPEDANPYVTEPIVTGLGNARNLLVVLNGAGVIAIGGRYGTLSEIALALDAGRPVAGLGTHDVDGVSAAETAGEAIDHVVSATR